MAQAGAVVDSLIPFLACGPHNSQIHHHHFFHMAVTVGWTCRLCLPFVNALT